MAGRLGTVHFRAFDRSDVFLVADVMPIELQELDEALENFWVDDLDAEHDWVTGCIQAKTEVDVDGDSGNIQCTYRADEGRPYILTIYLEYEEVETVPHEQLNSEG